MRGAVAVSNFPLEVSNIRSKTSSGVQGLIAPRIIVVLVLMICGGLSVQGQTIFGRISGTVQDKSGAVVPNATVTVTNVWTNLVRTATTDERPRPGNCPRNC